LIHKLAATSARQKSKFTCKEKKSPYLPQTHLKHEQTQFGAYHELSRVLSLAFSLLDHETFATKETANIKLNRRICRNERQTIRKSHHGTNCSILLVPALNYAAGPTAAISQHFPTCSASNPKHCRFLQGLVPKDKKRH